MIENLRTSDPKKRWNFAAKTFKNRSASVLGSARRDKWAPSAAQGLSRRVFDRPGRAQNCFPGAFSSPGAFQERSWSGPGALLASKASCQKLSGGDFGHPNRPRAIWRRFSDDFRSIFYYFRSIFGRQCFGSSCCSLDSVGKLPSARASCNHR